MAMGLERHIRVLGAVLLLLTLAKGSSSNKTCTVADLEIRHFQVDQVPIFADNRTQEQHQHVNSGAGAGGRKLNQVPMVMVAWVYNHCPCMVDNVVIYAPDGFPTIFPNGTDETVFSKVREHLYLINQAGPLQPSVCPPSSAPPQGDNICPSTSFFYYSYGRIQLEPAFLVPHC